MYSIPASFPFLDTALFTWGSSSLGLPLWRDSPRISTSNPAICYVEGRCGVRELSTCLREEQRTFLLPSDTPVTCMYVAHGPPVLPHTTQFFHNSFSGDIRIFLNHIIFVLLAIRTIYPIVVGVGRVWRRTSTNSLKAPTLFNTNSLTNI